MQEQTYHKRSSWCKYFIPDNLMVVLTAIPRYFMDKAMTIEDLMRGQGPAREEGYNSEKTAIVEFLGRWYDY